MSNSPSIQFNHSDVVHVNSSEYQDGEHVCGTHVLDPMGELSHNFRELFDCRKPARSHQVDLVDLSEGNLVDLEYSKSSNKVNTPYRIVHFYKGVKTRKQMYDASEREFVLVLEPIMRNAALVLVKGFIRWYDNGAIMSVYNDVFYKHKWDSPTVPEISDALWQPSVFHKLGFEHKNDRDLRKFSALFDELVADTVGVQEEVIALVV